MTKVIFLVGTFVLSGFFGLKAIQFLGIAFRDWRDPPEVHSARVEEITDYHRGRGVSGRFYWGSLSFIDPMTGNRRKFKFAFRAQELEVGQTLKIDYLRSTNKVRLHSGGDYLTLGLALLAMVLFWTFGAFITYRHFVRQIERGAEDSPKAPE